MSLRNCLTVLMLLVMALPSVAHQAGGGAKATVLAHDVYFALNDNSAEARSKLVEACKKYLTGQEGAVSFAVGTLASEMSRPVNDRDFDVALHIVFKDKASHDVYQKAALHEKFVAEMKPNWKKVRVFDSYVSAQR